MRSGLVWPFYSLHKVLCLAEFTHFLMPRFVISSKSYDDNQVLSGSIVSGFGRTELVCQLRRPKVMLNHNKRTNTSSNVRF